MAASCSHLDQVRAVFAEVDRHATQHARESEHPLVGSIEPGEACRFCYVDEVML